MDGEDQDQRQHTSLYVSFSFLLSGPIHLFHAERVQALTAMPGAAAILGPETVSFSSFFYSSLLHFCPLSCFFCCFSCACCWLECPIANYTNSPFSAAQAQAAAAMPGAMILGTETLAVSSSSLASSSSSSSSSSDSSASSSSSSTSSSSSSSSSSSTVPYLATEQDAWNYLVEVCVLSCWLPLSFALSFAACIFASSCLVCWFLTFYLALFFSTIRSFIFSLLCFSWFIFSGFSFITLLFCSDSRSWVSS